MLYWIACFIALATVPDLESGRQLRQEGRFEEAIEVFEELLSTQPDNFEAYRELGHSLVLAGRYREAIETYDKLATSEDPNWQLESIKWGGLTHLYLGEMENALAKNEGETALARKMGNVTAAARATWYRGHILTELGQFGEANSAFLETFEIDPDELNAFHLAGLMAARQGDTGSLRYQIEDIQQIVRRSSDESQMRRVYHLQAELALLQSQPKKALPPIEKAQSLFPHPLYRETLARVHLALEDTRAAEAVYRDIISATDERLDIPLYYVKTLNALALLLDAQGQEEEAASFYEKFLAYWGEAPGPLPGAAEAKARLAELRAGARISFHP